MLSSIVHSVERKAFEAALNSVIKRDEHNQKRDYTGIVNAIEAVLGDSWQPQAYDSLRTAFGKDGKWSQYLDRLIDNYDPEYLK